MLYELRRCQFCWLAQQKRWAEALLVARTQLTDLAVGHPRRQLEVEAAMMSLIPGTAGGPPLSVAASALQSSLRNALGIEARCAVPEWLLEIVKFQMVLSERRSGFK